MEAFKNVNKKDHFVCNKINIMLDKYNRLFNIMSIIISDLDMELKMEISRTNYLESIFLYIN